MCSARYRKENETVISRLPPTKEERSFQAFLWNRKAGTVLGRTASSWAKIGLFYIVFYAFLAGFFSLLMFVFYQTLDYHVPKYTGEESLLRNPGLSFRPEMDYVDDLRPTISYSPKYGKSFVYSIDRFLDPYIHRPSNAIDCLPVDEGLFSGSVCYFDIYNLNTTCSKDNDWGYETNSPCILLKLNKMFHWRPEPLLYLNELPEGLQQHINSLADSHGALRQNAWVWCESEEVGIEQLSPGLPISFFPYFNQEGYLAPFVFVRVLNLPVEQKVTVRCRAWASNIQHQRDNRLLGEAVIHFHLY
ncbi:hypothetical protein O3P69_005017 [Scylla paramamosain]|uniref:Uncharacterized protein n=1 Tax=Scylla paramamosain TaxID=85552 RepID=A0AAW0U9I5_SCYPA